MPTPPLLPSSLPPGSRRAFLAGACASAAPALLARGRGSDGRPLRLGDPEDMAAAARLSGLEFAEAELAQAEGRLERLRGNYRQLRAAKVPFELGPTTHFDPLPPGHDAPATEPGPAFTAPDAPQVDGDTDLAFATVAELGALLRAGAVTSRQLTELALARLAAHDPKLLCVITPLRDEALATADERDRELAAGTDRGPLHGIPYGAKDLFAWPTAPTTFGAGPYRDFVWPIRATVLDKLHARGAVLVAKLSLGALAMGDLWHGGRTRNPWNPERGSSGSSAGSASAVAAGLVPFALGTETLGSIVSPCRQCGVGGLRPTFGTVSRHGAMPLSWTMDKVGPIARSAEDLAIVYDAIRGRDGADPATRDAAFAYRSGQDLQGLRFGVLAGDRMLTRPEDQRFLAWLAAQGAKPVEVTLPEAPYRSMLLMLHAEAACAFDDLLRAGKLDELPGQDDGDWPNSFRSSRTIPAVEYLRASRLRRQLLADVHEALAGVDVLVAPTHGGPTLTCTNLTGHPTAVVPVGASERGGGRPTMLALVGQLYGDAALLRTAAAWQRDTDWHQRRPELTS